MILAIDPGPRFCGLVVYAPDTRRVLEAHSALSIHGALVALWCRYRPIADLRLAIERVQSTGQSGASLLQTAEVVGRLWQAGIHAEAPVRLIYRREVLRALDVTGRGNRDALVRQRVIEMLGDKGTKRAPGPTYGVSGHAWQALGVALAAELGAGEVVT